MPITHKPNLADSMPSSIHSRKVTFGDSLEMKRKAGEWFEVHHSRANSNGAASMAHRLRIDLPRWYGGRWEATARAGRVYVRFVGEEDGQ